MNEMAITGVGVTLPGAKAPEDVLASTECLGEPPGWFDVSTALPGRGYKRLPVACQYLLAASAEALADAGDPLRRVPAERRGLVVGTNNAATALTDRMDRTIIDAGADEISPLAAPFFAVSLLASRVAAEHSIRGFALTANSPRTAGLEALQLGSRALARGRGEALLVGATEDTLPRDEPGNAGSESGSVVLVCVPTASGTNGASYGTCRVRTAFLAPGVTPGGVLDEAWNAVCAGAREPRVVDAVLDDSPVGEAVAAWLATKPVSSAPVRAGAGCLSPLRRVAGLLATGASDHVVVTAAAEGGVAFAQPVPHDRAGLEVRNEGNGPTHRS